MILKTQLKLKNKKQIIDTVYKMESQLTKHESVVKGKSSYYQCQIYEKYEDVFIPIVEQFKKMAGEGFNVFEFWVQIYKTGGYVLKHNHLPSFPELKDVPMRAGVYYLQKPKNGGNINIDNLWYDVKEDDMIMFGNHLDHYTEPNKSKKDRIICSINLAKGYIKKWNKKLERPEFFKV